MTLDHLPADPAQLRQLLEVQLHEYGKLETRCAFFERSAQEWKQKHLDIVEQLSGVIRQLTEQKCVLKIQCEEWAKSQRTCLLTLGLSIGFVKGFLEVLSHVSEIDIPSEPLDQLYPLRENAHGWLNTMPVELLEAILRANTETKETEVLDAPIAPDRRTHTDNPETF